MNTENMPAAEANSYELAFHVLPTVAEGEVATVLQSLKDVITKHGGTLTAEEAPARIDLAYEIVKHLEGRNRKFTSAYFGWVRFEIDPSKIVVISEAVEHTKELLRYLLIKLTKSEEEHPFFYHEAMAAQNQKVETIDLSDETEAADTAEDEVEEEDSVDTEDDDDDTVGDDAITTENGEDSKDKV